eukprot:365808-Chlamydomonas_euryale.AAC.18
MAGANVFYQSPQTIGSWLLKCMVTGMFGPDGRAACKSAASRARQDGLVMTAGSEAWQAAASHAVLMLGYLVPSQLGSPPVRACCLRRSLFVP